MLINITEYIFFGRCNEILKMDKSISGEPSTSEKDGTSKYCGFPSVDGLSQVFSAV